MRLTQKQNKYIRNSTARWNFQIGAARSGKSYVNVAFSIPKNIRSRAGKSGLAVILGVSKGTIERNVLKPMREIYTDRLVGTINGNNIARVFGEDVYCLGAEKITQVSKIVGASIKYCYGDEIAKWNEDVFSLLPSRLDKEYSLFEGACNPEHPNHWLKAFIDRDDIDSYVQHYTIFDNPNLPKAVVESMCREYAGTVFYDRLILGEWAVAEGLVYPCYANTVPTVKRRYTEYAVSMDYGTMNPTAMLLWGKCDGVWYAFREYYHSGRDTQKLKTDQEYYDDLERLCEDVELPTGAKIPLIIDPSAASFIALAQGRHRFKVLRADNTVLDGIRHTASALAAKKIMFCDCCKNTIDEFGLYSWDPAAVEDRVIKDNDHSMDAVRYFVQTKRIYRDRGLR